MLFFEEGFALGELPRWNWPERSEELGGRQFVAKVEKAKGSRSFPPDSVAAMTETTQDKLNLLDALAAIAPEENAAGDGEYDGTLPEFSDSEENPAPSTSRAPLNKLARGGKRRPIIAGVGKKLQAVTKVVKKDSSTQLTPQALDAVMAKLGTIDASITREDIPALLEKLQLDKQVLQGKKGLMGKGTKDMGYAYSRTHLHIRPLTRSTQRSQILENATRNQARHAFVNRPLRLRSHSRHTTTAVDEVKEGPLEPNKVGDQIRQTPYDLHKDFVWVSMDMTAPAQLKEVYELLTQNYVEDEDASFRFDYSADFFDWCAPSLPHCVAG